MACSSPSQLVGFGVAVAIQAHFNSELRSALRKQYPEATEEKLAQVTLDGLCEQLRADARDLCETNDNLNLMGRGAVGAGVAGLFLLLVIRLAGTLARNSRSLLASVFKPGLYLTVLVLTGLIIVHAAVAMAAIYYGESALIDRIHVESSRQLGSALLLVSLRWHVALFQLSERQKSLLLVNP